MVKNQLKSEFSIKPYLSVKGDTVLLVGNRGYRNLGDELILLGNVKLLLQQDKKVTIACYEPERLRRFFIQFIDVSKVRFIPELPKGFHSFFRYVFRYGMRGFFTFLRTDTIILGGGEILTDENPGSYRYWIASIRPFLQKKRWQIKYGTKKESNLYIMGGVQIPKFKRKRKSFRSLLKYATVCYLRDFEAIKELSPYANKCDFFMDTSYFAYDWDKVTIDKEKKIEKPYIVVNLNKNAEQFFDELVVDIKRYSEKGYRIYYVPVAKGRDIYYDDLQYSQRLEKALGEDIDFALLDWEADFDSFVKVLKGAKKVFSSRLHLYLIASFLGCDTKVYPYQRKILKMQKVVDELL